MESRLSEPNTEEQGTIREADFIEKNAGSASQAATADLHQMNGITDASVTLPVSDQRDAQDIFGVSQQELALLMDVYLAQANHVFPMFDRSEFADRLRLSNTDSNKKTPKRKATVYAVLSMAYRLRSFSREAGDPAAFHTLADRRLDFALTFATELLLDEPSLSSVQALICIAVGLLWTPHSHHRAAPLLAVAIRQAFALDLHQLNNVTGITVEERLERIRTFWCLYIIDKEMCLRTHKPSLIDDEELFILEPKVVSNDLVGMLNAGDGTASINVFAARQRLSRIQSLVHAKLWTFKARHAILVERVEAVVKLNESLAEWKSQYWDVALDALDSWPKEAHIHLVRLQLAYFHCLVQANPGSPTNVEKIDAFLENPVAIGKTGYTPEAMVQAARDTLRLAKAIQRGGTVWLVEALQTVIPAILFLLCISVTAGHMLQESDRELVEAWLVVLEHLSLSSADGEIKATVKACRKLQLLKMRSDLLPFTDEEHRSLTGRMLSGLVDSCQPSDRLATQSWY